MTEQLLAPTTAPPVSQIFGVLASRMHEQIMGGVFLNLETLGALRASVFMQLRVALHPPLKKRYAF